MTWHRSTIHLPLALATLASACSTAPLGATDAELAHARNQSKGGALVYERHCAQCHGDHGEGLAGTPPLMGDDALPVHPRNATPAREYATEERAPGDLSGSVLATATRGPFRTALDVHVFLTDHMPKVRQTAAPPTDGEYWDVVSFLLVANGADVPSDGVNASNGAAVAVPP